MERKEKRIENSRRPDRQLHSPNHEPCKRSATIGECSASKSLLRVDIDEQILILVVKLTFGR